MGYWLLGGSVAAVLLIGWWSRRRSKVVDDYHDREYREPPSFQMPGGDGPL